MSNLKSKFARRIMAIVLSGAMVMSNMSAYAAELTPEKETEIVSEVEERENDTADDAAEVEDKTSLDKNAADNSGNGETSDSSSGRSSVERDSGDDENQTETVDAPEELQQKEENDNIVFSWTAVTKDGYDIKYVVSLKEKDANNAFEMLSDVETEDTSVSVSKTDFTARKTYTFSVKTVAATTGNSESESIESTEATVDYTVPGNDSGVTTLAKPENLTAELNSEKDGVVVSWDPVENADSYEVTAKEQGDEASAEVKKTVNAEDGQTSVSVTFSLSGGDSLSRGKSYKFSVIAKKDGTTSEAAETTNAVTIPDNSTPPPEDATNTYVLTGADVGAVTAGDANASRTDRAGTDGYFKINFNDKSQVDSNGSAREWAADYSGEVGTSKGVGADYILPKTELSNPTYRIRMNAYSSGSRPAIGFTTDAESIKVRVWWAAGGSGNRHVKLVDSEGKDISGLEYTTTTTNGYLCYNDWELTNNSNNTYYIVNSGGDNYFFKAEVVETREEEKERTWSAGTNPSVSMSMKDENGTPSTDTVTVNVSDISLSDDGADKLVVEIFKEGETKAVDTKTVRTEGITSYSYDYQITDSGNYTAKATLTRTIAGAYDETNKTATNADDTDNAKTAESSAVTIDLSLDAPENFTAQQVNNKYEVKLSWDIVNGGDGYQITVSEKDASEVLATYTITDKSTTTYTAAGYGENNETSFAAGKTYTFTIKSTNGDTLSEDSAAADVTINEVATGNTVEYILDATGWTAETKAAGTIQTEDIFTISYGSAGKIVDTSSDVTATEWTAVNADSVPEKYAPSDPKSLKGINFNGKYTSSSNNLTARYIEFTTTSAADVKVFWGLSGDGDRNLVLFKDKDASTPVAKTTLTGGLKANAYYSEFTLEEAATYELTVDANISIYKVIVIMEAAPADTDTEDYILDATEWTAETKAAGATQTEGIFTISYGSAGKIVDTSGDVTATEWTAVNADSVPEKYAPSNPKGLKAINFNGKYTSSSNNLTARYIEFTTTSAADVKVFWGLSGDGDRNLVLFKDKDASTPVAKTTLTGGLKASAYYSEFALEEAATYELTVDANVSIYKVIVTMEKGTGEPEGPEAPTDWADVAAPEITVEEYDDTYGARTGKILVTVKAVVSDSETEKVTVHMYDMSGKEVGTAKESNTKANEHKFEFEPTYTSSYRFDAVLSRTVKGADDKETVFEKKSEKTPFTSFTLPLAAPKILDYANMGTIEGSNPVSGSVELSWGSVDEATGYIVTAVDEGGNEVFNSGTITSTTITIKEALEIGKKYTFSVAARREFTGENGGLETSEKGTTDLTITETADTFDAGKYILDAGLLEQGSHPNAVVKAGRYSADQNAPDVLTSEEFKKGDATIPAGVEATLDLIRAFEEKNYFTIMFGSGTSAQVSTDNNKVYPNNFVTSSRLELGSAITAGTVPTSAAIKFKTSASSRVDIYWRTNSAGRGVQILNSKGAQVGFKTNDATSDETGVGLLATSFYLNDAGTYYIGLVNGNVRITRVVVYDGYEKKERPQWTTDPVEGKDSVTAPVIISAALKEGSDNTIAVKASADIGAEASADGVTVYMTYKDENGEEQIADYKTSTTEGTEHEFEFTPGNSNKYYFSAKMTREDEETTIDSIDTDSEGNDIRKFVDFTLPLGNVAIKSITNKGKADDNYGIVEAVWSSVTEAVYEIEVKDSTGASVYRKIETGNLTTIGKKEAGAENSGWQDNAEGLAIGAKYTLNVTAMRAKPAAEGAEIEYERTATATQEFEITGKNTTTWTFSNFGSRANIKTVSGTEAGCGDDSLIDTDPDSKTVGQKLVKAGMVRNGYDEISMDENDNPTKVRVWSIATYGKIVPNSTDGVALYYTSVDPSHYNFRLSADVHVDQWTISNGQDGFGVLAFDQVRDTVGSDTDEGGDVWNNSYMAVATKMEYKWDDENQKVSNAGSSVSLKLGIGSIARTGVTAENISEFNNNATVSEATNKYFRSVSKPLDTQVHDKTYDNLIGNLTNPGSEGNTISPAITDLRMEIELNDTGYFVSYTPITVNQETREVISVGEKITNKFYDRNALSQIDKDYVYPGLFAARNAVVTFSNIDFSTTPYDAATAQPESKEVEYVAPSYSIVSATTSNSEDYLLTYQANWHGKVVVRDENGDVILSEDITGSPEILDKAELLVKLNIGDNTFQTTFEPDESYDPYDGDPLTRLDNYDTQTDLITVTYKKYGLEGQALYVAPQGKATGDGTQKNPLDIYTAVKYVQPGQTIYLMDGTYDLSNTIRIERGTDGTKDQMIRMVPAKAGSRPVFDFHNACEGMIIAGDYWYFYGFDVTRSSDGNDGIRVCGDYNTLDSINTYKNGNTGIQISRLLSSDTNINTDWPKYNTIKNCTSYLNADGGYEDADGFACKLTSGVGNKFIGCVAAYNADDGWDLYAKVETGPIGLVTIENCVAYKNGYVLRADNGNGELAWYGEAENVAEVNAGNGNGFKMGGSSISGYHTLKNSLSFYNKAKGFDSNSCPDIQVYDSITFNNESYNVAFYTNAATTDFAARGLISYRTDALKVTDTDGKEVTLLTGMEDRIGQKLSTIDNYSNIINTQQKGMSKVFNNSNYFWNQYSQVSEIGTDFVQNYTTYYTKTVDGKFENPPAVNQDHIVKDSWFESLDFDGENGWLTKLISESEADHTAHVADRNANGTINMGKFLQLTAEAGMAGSGLPDFSESTDDTVVSKNPDDFAGVEETNGTIDKGNAEDEIDNIIDPEDLKKKPGTATDQVGLWFSIVNEDEIGYTGKAVKPEVRVYYDNTLLTKKDYTITYKNNINAWIGDTAEGIPVSGYESDLKKIPTIIVKGKGNYNGQAKEIWFEIKPVDLANDVQNRVSAPAITLLKANQAVKPVITFAGKKLSDNKDYIAGETKVDEAGNKWLEVTGKGNFTGSIDIKVRDASNAPKENLASSFKVDSIKPQYRKGYETDYTGRIIKYFKVEPLTQGMVKTKNGDVLNFYNPETGEGDIMVEYVNNIEIGTATAIITGINNYYGTKEVKFKIIAPPVATLLKEGKLTYIDTEKLIYKAEEGKTTNYDKNTEEITSIADVKFEFAPAYDYSGKAIQWDNLGIAAEIDGKWYKLDNNTDYTLTYRGNNKAGTASVVVKGKGNYSGSITQSFKINPFDISAHIDQLGGTFTLNEDKTAQYFEGTPSESGKNTISYGTMKNTVYYDKAGAKPTISLRINGNLMTAGKDYTITYKNNMKAGQDATFTIKGKGALTGTITGTYKIEKRPFNDPENRLQVTATDVKLTSKDGDGFKGKNNTKIVVKDAKGKTLSLNKDYVIDRYEYVNNDTYALLDVEPITDNKAEVRIASKDTYHTVKVTVRGTGDNYTDAELSTYYRITWGKNSIKSAKAQIIYDAGGKDNPGLANKYFYYKEGGAVTLNNDTLKLTLDGKELTFGVDYKVIGYSKNDRKGTAKLTIEGKGEYVETKVITFKIGADDFIWWKDKNIVTTSQELLRAITADL